jgi:hypothetical protein
MNRRALILIALALAFPAAAAAKGPDAATVSGPGLSGQVPIGGIGEGDDGTPLGGLVSYGGYFPEVFGQSPDPTTRAQPQGDLGPGYTVTYRVPGPNGKSTIHQIVYPYAKPAPVTYMEPDQPFWDGQKTHGGWYVAAAQVKDILGKVGMPATAPSDGSGFWRTWMLTPILAAALALAALALLRRPWPLRGSRPVPGVQ